MSSSARVARASRSPALVSDPWGTRTVTLRDAAAPVTSGRRGAHRVGRRSLVDGRGFAGSWRIDRRRARPRRSRDTRCGSQRLQSNELQAGIVHAKNLINALATPRTPAGADHAHPDAVSVTAAREAERLAVVLDGESRAAKRARADRRTEGLSGDGVRTQTGEPESRGAARFASSLDFHVREGSRKADASQVSRGSRAS